MAGRIDLGEKYLARELAAGAHGADPIVRILAVVRYPRQHALYWPEVAVEVPPVEKGCVCRMHALRRGPHPPPFGGPTARGLPARHPLKTDPRAGFPGAAGPRAAGGRLRNAPRRIPLYVRSLEWARARALEACADPAQREILERHAEGVYLRRRQAVRFKMYELEKYKNGY